MLESSECVGRVNGPGWLFLVSKIGENLALGRPPAQRIFGHVELRCIISTLTQPVAREGSGHNIRSLQIVALGNAECDTMTPQYSVSFVGEPCAVPKFESHPQATGIRIQKEGVEARYVRLEIGRKLEEHHAHPSSGHNQSERDKAATASEQSLSRRM